jgi:CDP-diacylglycerol--glycerol-3-phosphate 3-phosphatidyltransferase
MEFVALLLFLLLTDWLDGKLAILLDQRTSFGARLDSVADAVLLGALIVGVWLLVPEAVHSERYGILAMLASFTISVVAGLIKFGRPPSYHTWSAKISWWLVTLGAILIFWNGSLWLIRIALISVVLSNLEAILITLTIPEWRADVRSIFLVWRKKRA